MGVQEFIKAVEQATAQIELEEDLQNNKFGEPHLNIHESQPQFP